jgi:hypothetical protein
MSTEESELPMTTYVPPSEVLSPPVEVKDPYPNKAIAAAVTTLATVGAQWIATGAIQLDQEGITLIGGAVATILVYAVSNWKRKGR